MTHLEQLFASLTWETDLEALLQARREEDLYFEFKEKADRSRPDIDDADRRGLSRALSGFANADGGVIVFGIATRKVNGVDCADELKPITGHKTFRARLGDLLLNTTHPPVIDGVVLETIDAAADANRGYVKCIIPPSDRPPHRAIHADPPHLYWRRTATGHRRMDHYELEDMFGRRLRPVLRLSVELRPRQPAGDPFEDVHFFLLNEGRGVARHPGFHCTLVDAPLAGTTGDNLRNESNANLGRPTVTFYDAHGVIHPNGLFSAPGHAIVRRDNKGAPLVVKALVYAENMQAKTVGATVLPGARTDLVAE